MPIIDADAPRENRIPASDAIKSSSRTDLTFCGFCRRRPCRATETTNPRPSKIDIGGTAMATDLEARVRELENTVQQLRDREAIRDLRYRYHEYVNEGKFAEIPGLFTADGELDFEHLGQANGQGETAIFFGALNYKAN